MRGQSRRVVSAAIRQERQNLIRDVLEVLLIAMATFRVSQVKKGHSKDIEWA